MWMTPFSFCSSPVTLISRAPMMIGRKRSNVARPQDRVGDASLVLQRHEDGVAGARTLAHQHEPGDRHASAGDNVGQKLVPDDAARIEVGAQERHRMRLQRQMQMPVILDHLLARQHRRQTRRRARARPWRRARTAADRPCRRRGCSALTAHSASRRLKPERAEGVGLRELFQRGRFQPCAQPEIAHGIETLRRGRFRSSWRRPPKSR